MSRIKNDTTGFTLIEVIVAMAILSIVLTAVTTVLNANFALANSTKESFIASGLLQEGVEAVRNIRDSAWYRCPGQDQTSLDNCFNTTLPDGSYEVQWDSTGLIFSTDRHLNYDDVTGLYGYDMGSESIFKREVAIVTVQPSIEKKITVTISWIDRGLPKSLSAEEHLFNWR